MMMTGNRRRDRAIWWVSGFAAGFAVLMGWLGDSLMRPILFATVPSVACVLAYGVLGPWFRTTLGRILFALMLVMALMLTITIANLLWDYPGQVTVARAMFLLTGVVFWTLLAYLLVTAMTRDQWLPKSYRRRRRTEQKARLVIVEDDETDKA